MYYTLGSIFFGILVSMAVSYPFESHWPFVVSGHVSLVCTIMRRKGSVTII